MAGSRIYRGIKKAAINYIDSYYLAYKILTIKDPCKKCLVRACCTEICAESEYSNRLKLPHKTLREAKLFTGVLFFSVIVAHLTIIIVLIKKVIIHII